MKCTTISWLLMLFPFFVQTQSLEKLMDFSDFRTIQSTTSDDFSDLQFLKKDLKNKRIVMLGEFTHGAKEINELKIRLIKFLHREMDFEILSLESDFAGMVGFNHLQKRNYDPNYLIYQGIVGVWLTEEYQDFMHYLVANPNLEVNGFDGQKSSSNFKRFLKSIFSRIDTVVGKKAFDLEANGEFILKRMKKENLSEQEILQCKQGYQQLFGMVENYVENLQTSGLSKVQIQFLKKAIENRIAYLTYYTRFKNDLPQRFRARDSLMAINLAWIAEEVFPDKKIIVSGHNYHISKKGAEEPVMGSLLPKSLKKETYSIGIYALSGAYTSNNQQPKQLETPMSNNLRQVLSEMPYDWAFLPLKKYSKKYWTEHPIEVDGFVTLKGIQALTLCEHFDGLLILKKVSVPTFVY